MAGETPPPSGSLLQSVASLPIELNVAKPPALGHFEVAAAEQGQSIVMKCALKIEPELLNIHDLVATLEGLPNRVACDPISIKPESQTLDFKVSLESTAPLGRYVGLVCRLSGKIGNEFVSYVVSRDGELTIASPGQIVRDANGRPLNRVEALRKKVSQGSSVSDAR